MRQKKLTRNKYKRVYHHYLNQEEFHSVMWRQIPVDQREAASIASRDLMIDADRFELACVRAINEWPKSAEANFTASVINHQAWLGHAACCLNHGASEDLTRLGWRMLSQVQQDAANAAADRAIAYWENSYEVSNPKNVKRKP
jgi:hypothetical protein